MTIGLFQASHFLKSNFFRNKILAKGLKFHHCNCFALRSKFCAFYKIYFTNSFKQ